MKRDFEDGGRDSYYAMNIFSLADNDIHTAVNQALYGKVEHVFQLSVSWRNEKLSSDEKRNNRGKNSRDLSETRSEIDCFLHDLNNQTYLKINNSSNN